MSILSNDLFIPGEDETETDDTDQAENEEEDVLNVIDGAPNVVVFFCKSQNVGCKNKILNKSHYYYR